MGLIKFVPKRKTISTEEAARMLKVNERTIRKYLENFKLDGRKVKNRWQVNIISVWMLMADRHLL